MKKNIGLDVSPPKKECGDEKCPWHGALSVRGRTIQAAVKSAKSHKTVVVQWEYNRFVRKFERFERGKSSVQAHNPDCIKAKEGDQVMIAECRPLSKTKSFVVVGLAKTKEV